MNFPVEINGIKTDINVKEGGITYHLNDKEKIILYEDIVGLEKTNGKDFHIYHIQDHPYPNNTLTKECITITTETDVYQSLQSPVQSKIQTVTERPKKLVIFVNPIGGKGKGEQACTDIVIPVLTLAGIQTDVVVSKKAGHAKEFAETYDFKSMDGLVIMGGDGTISEIINVIMRKTQIDADLDVNDCNGDVKKVDFPIAVIPTGTGNGLVQAIHGCKDIMTSTLHILKGRKSCMHTLGNYNDNKLIGYAIMLINYGLFCEVFYVQDERYRWMRHLRSYIVPLWYFLFKPYREVSVEITYEYLKGSEPDGLSEQELTSLKVTERKKIINAVATSYNLEFDEHPPGTKRDIKDQFDLIDYKKCSRLSMLTCFKNLFHLTKEYLDRTDFITHSVISGFRMKILDDNDPADTEMNLIYNIDGETCRLKTPDIYVKLLPRCFTVFSSYNGPKRWW